MLRVLFPSSQQNPSQLLGKENAGDGRKYRVCKSSSEELSIQSAESRGVLQQQGTGSAQARQSARGICQGWVLNKGPGIFLWLSCAFPQCVRFIDL